jgi:hypothetical protein
MADVLELENVEEFEDGGADREVRVTLQDDDMQAEDGSVLSISTSNLGPIKEKPIEMDDQSVVSQLKEKAKRRKGRGFGAGDDRNDRRRDAYDR